jgi:hypothetical protein
MGTTAHLVAWLHLLPTVAGLVVSLASLGRSRWAAVLAAGFACQLLAQLFYRVATWFFATGLMRAAGPGAGLALASLIGFAGAVAIVVGVAGLLHERRR